MSVVVFPGQHAGARQPGVFAVRVPQIEYAPYQAVLSGVDFDTMAAIRAELAVFEAGVAALDKSTDRIVALLRPFMVEGGQ